MLLSMKILPVRFGMLHSKVIASECSCIRYCPIVSQIWRAAAKSRLRTIGTKMCRPVLPEVFTTGFCSPSRSSSCFSQNATSLPFSNAFVFSSGSAPGASFPE